jgi:hypothetical protein
MGPLAASAILLFGAWDVLLLGRLASRWTGVEAATFASFVLVTLLVAGARVRGLREKSGAALLRVVLGAVAGYTGYPVWVTSIAAIGLGLGLAPRDPGDPRAIGIPLIVASVALAPVFEEILYRDRLLLALRARAGATVAVLLTSILFALPHVEAWSLLGTFLVGLALGVTRLAAGSLALCIGIHAGLNLASVLWSPR